MLEVTSINKRQTGSKSSQKKSWGTSQKVANYFLEAEDDYYSKEGDFSAWQGKGAATLGLEGKNVDAIVFQKLLHGKFKGTELKKPTTRMALDFTFKAPKSVSIQALVGQDKRLIEAHDKAVEAAMQVAEKMAKARITINKETSRIDTGNLVIAKFRHETSRKKDPLIHTHALVLNMTQRKDGEWVSLLNDTLFQNKKFISTVYKSEMAKQCAELGYDIRHDKKSDTFELAMFSKEQIEKFSNRSKEIEEALAEKGLTRETATRKEKIKASLETREKKDHNIDKKALFEEWKKRANDAGIETEYLQKTRLQSEKIEKRIEGKEAQKTSIFGKERLADEAVRFAVNSLTERQTVIEANVIKHAALDHAIGKITLNDIDAAMARALRPEGYLLESEPLYSDGITKDLKGKDIYKTKAGWIEELITKGLSYKEAEKFITDRISKEILYSDKVSYTTKQAVITEKEILSMEKENRGSISNSINKNKVDTILSKYTLSAEQEAAVRNIAYTTNRFIGAHGYAGVGKSYMTKAAKEVLEENGFKTKALAPYGNQVKALQSEGMDAKTLASFLKAKEKGIDNKTVVFIDEAGVIPARQMNEVMKVIKENGARAVFLGDTSQTKAVEAGKPFDQLIKEGMETSYVSKIQRQKNEELLQAVQSAAEGKTVESLKRIDKNIHEIKEEKDRHQLLVQKYAALTQEERAKTLIVTGTNESRIDINKKVREALQIAGTGELYSTLNRYDSTREERKHSRYYDIGTIIQPEENYKKFGLVRGEIYKVVENGGVKENLLTVEDLKGNRFSFNPTIANKISLYKHEDQELAVGDRIRITRNDKTLDLANGDQFFIKGFTNEKMILESVTNPKRMVEIDKNKPLFVTHAYSTTVHSAQGMTCDRSLVNIDTKSLTTTWEVFYVAISRAKLECQIYTDNKELLPIAIAQKSIKTSALDLNWKKDLKGKDRLQTEKSSTEKRRYTKNTEIFRQTRNKEKEKTKSYNKQNGFGL